MLSIGFQAPIPRVGGTLDGKPKGVRVSATRGVPTLNNDFTGLCQRSPVFSSGCRQFFFGSPRSQFQNPANHIWPRRPDVVLMHDSSTELGRAVPAEDVRLGVFLWPAHGCVEAVWGAFRWVTRKLQRFL